MATVEQLKKQIAESDLEVARLTPAFNQAKTAENAAQAALDAFYARPGKVSLNQLSAARTAANANPADATAQQTFQNIQAQWNTQQEEFRPLLQARDNAAAATIEARRPIVAAEEAAGQADLAIARIDPAQASEDARAALAEQDGTTPLPDTVPTSTSASPTFTASTQAFDDGSTLQTFEDGSTLATAPDGTTTSTPAPDTNVTTTESPTTGAPNVLGTPLDDDGNLNPGWVPDDNAPDGYSYVGTGIDASARTGAATSDDTSGQGDTGDTRAGVSRGATPSRPPGAQAQWAEAKDLRVKLRVPNEYLKGPSAGPANILQKNGGILFPYTPTISVENQASYASQSPLHSNYAQYFYKNSAVSPINLTAKFTVQNEFEGAVLLGVLHLLRSLTKMKWGNDPDAGSPPPVCRFDAYGDYMLFNVPVAIASWRHELPDSVDYITIGRPGSPTTYGRTMVPVLSTINITMNVMYSRREMLEYNVKDWLSGGLRYRGYL
jgi:hypothetical protein